MPTPFTKVYESFLSQTSSYNLRELAVNNQEALKDNLELWLMGSIGFFESCRKDLTDFDLTTKVFNEELNAIEIQILAKFMLLQYLDTYMYKEELLEQSLNSKDYRMYSPANQIKALISMKIQINSEANTLMSRYSYKTSKIKELFKR